jgi:hypothetical protein
MKKQIISIGLMLSSLVVSAWNPMKVGQTFPFNRLMLDGDGELTSLDDLLAEGRPVVMATNTTDCPNCHQPNMNFSNWINNNPSDAVKMTVIFIIHEFHQSAKMGYSNASQTGQNKGYVNDWKNIFTGYKNATGFANNSAGDQWFFPDEQGSTPFWWNLGLGRTFMTRAGGGDGWQKCRDEILALYSSNKLTSYSSQCKKPSMTVQVSGNEATITLTNNEPNSILHYTVDGSIPNDNSPIYSGPFKVKSSRLVRAQSRKANAFPSKVVIKPVVITSNSFVNVAPQGTAYVWNNDYSTGGTSDANKTAKAGLNDNNIATDVKLVDAARQKYADGDTPFKYAKWQGGGVVWNTTMENITHLEYIQGTLNYQWWGAHGTYIWDIKLQITTDGVTWKDAEKYGYFKEFPFGKFYGGGKPGGGGSHDYPSSQIVPSPQDPVTFYLDKPTALRGFRIVGGFNVHTGYEQPDYINVRELRAYQNNTITSSEDIQLAESFNLYPNPANNILNISIDESSKVDLVNIADLAGKVILSQNAAFNNGHMNINVSELSKGAYMVSLIGNKKINKIFMKE